MIGNDLKITPGPYVYIIYIVVGIVIKLVNTVLKTQFVHLFELNLLTILSAI